MLKLSIVVPVYNVEKYIVKCLESLLMQELDNFEIIVVNDGSTDKSMEEILKIKDKRIKIINQKNKGLSGARNTGIKEASGEYIALVDSDDYIANKYAFREMYEIAKRDNSDVVTGSCVEVYEDGRIKEIPLNLEVFNKNPIDGEEFLLRSIKSKRVYAPVWLSIYRRKFLEKYNLEFFEGIVHEDEEFTPRALIRANKISLINNLFYMYRQRSGSIMNSKKSEKYGRDKLKIAKILEQDIKNIKSEELKKVFYRRLSALVLNAIYDYKLNDIDKGYLTILEQEFYGKDIKIRKELLKLNPKLFIAVEKVYRVLRDLKNK